MILNRAGFRGGRFDWVLRGDTGHRKLGIVGGFGLSGRDVADRSEETSVIEPADPFEGGELDRFEVAPGAAPMDQLGFVEAVDGFGEGIDAPMSVKQFLAPAAAACKAG